jgi:hypothetical protein
MLRTASEQIQALHQKACSLCKEQMPPNVSSKEREGFITDLGKILNGICPSKGDSSLNTLRKGLEALRSDLILDKKHGENGKISHSSFRGRMHNLQGQVDTCVRENFGKFTSKSQETPQMSASAAEKSLESPKVPSSAVSTAPGTVHQELQAITPARTEAPAAPKETPKEAIQGAHDALKHLYHHIGQASEDKGISINAIKAEALKRLDTIITGLAPHRGESSCKGLYEELTTLRKNVEEKGPFNQSSEVGKLEKAFKEALNQPSSSV